MRAVPRNQVPKITFYKVRLPKWAEHAEQIGLNPDDVVTMQARTDAAAAAMATQRRAQQAAEVATLALSNALDAMATMGAGMLMQIRAKAGMTGDNAVYPLAGISPPTKGSPIGQPGTPSDFEYSLDVRGALQLKWKCRNPRGSTGTMYQVYRQVDGGELKLLGTIGKKRIVDTSVPSGASSVMYQVRAVRSTGIGAWGQFFAKFGISGRIPVLQAA